MGFVSLYSQKKYPHQYLHMYMIYAIQNNIKQRMFINYSDYLCSNNIWGNNSREIYNGPQCAGVSVMDIQRNPSTHAIPTVANNSVSIGRYEF